MLVVDSFDPYHKWLGIPAHEQPPHYYRLLGLQRFEGDQEVIQNAVLQRKRHLRSFQFGPQREAALRLIGELDEAEACLTNAERKADYDASLAVSPPAALSPPPSLTPPLIDLGSMEDGEDSDSVERAVPAFRKTKNPIVEFTKIVAGGAAGLAIGYILLSFMREDWDTLGLAKATRNYFKEDQTAVLPEQPANRERETQQESPRTLPASEHSLPKPTAPPVLKPVVEPKAAESPQPDPRNKPETVAAKAPDVFPELDIIERDNLAGDILPPPTEKWQPPSAEVAASVVAKVSFERFRKDAGPLLLDALHSPKPEECYVLILESRAKAIAAGDATLAARCVNALAERFVVAEGELRTQTLTAVREKCESADQFAALAESALEAFSQAQAAHDDKQLLPLPQLALDAARKTSSAELPRRATLALLEARQAQKP